MLSFSSMERYLIKVYTWVCPSQLHRICCGRCSVGGLGMPNKQSDFIKAPYQKVNRERELGLDRRETG